MERLTKKVHGVWTALCRYEKSPFPIVTQEIIDRLAAYEDTGFTPAEVQQMQWIPVEERLPTDERPVLVFVGYADTMTGFITTSSYFCFDANPHWQWDGLVRNEQRTLFWMPLPAPPDRRPPEGDEKSERM